MPVMTMRLDGSRSARTATTGGKEREVERDVSGAVLPVCGASGRGASLSTQPLYPTSQCAMHAVRWGANAAAAAGGLSRTAAHAKPTTRDAAGVLAPGRRVPFPPALVAPNAPPAPARAPSHDWQVGRHKGEARRGARRPAPIARCCEQKTSAPRSSPPSPSPPPPPIPTHRGGRPGGSERRRRGACWSAASAW